MQGYNGRYKWDTMGVQEYNGRDKWDTMQCGILAVMRCNECMNDDISDDHGKYRESWKSTPTQK